MPEKGIILKYAVLLKILGFFNIGFFQCRDCLIWGFYSRQEFCLIWGFCVSEDFYKISGFEKYKDGDYCAIWGFINIPGFLIWDFSR